MNTIRLTMAQALVKFLDNQFVNFDGQDNKFVKGIFALFGHGCVVGLGNALEEYRGDIVLYQGHNEQGMAHAAIGYAKQKNRREIIACASSIGPGALNMVTAAGTASVNRIPLLLFPGDTFACRQPDPVLQQVENPNSISITANDAFKPVSKYWDRIQRPEQLMTAILNAMRVLTDPAETGAVTICLPQDVQAEAYDYPAEFFEKRIHYIDRKIPSERSILKAVEIVKASKKPLIICGGGAAYSEAQDELLSFAENFNIPIGETQAGKGLIPWNHRLNLGGIGVTGGLAANITASEADLIIAVGTRLSDFTTASKSAFKNPEVKLLTINVNSFDGEKMNAHLIHADALLGVQALSKVLKAEDYRSSYGSEIRKEKDEWDKEINRLGSIEVKDGLSQTTVLAEINKTIGDEAIVVGSSGSLPGCMQRMWRSSKPKTYHMEYGFSCMGYEVCAALGVKMAAKDREVYSMVGDGSYIMLHSELLTSIQEGLKINVLLFDNNGFQCIKNLECAQGIGNFGTEFRYRNEESGRLDGEYIPIDFSMMAKALGVKSYRVRTMEDLRTALENIKTETVSTLLDIKVLPGTMTGGYEAWWRVGVPEAADKESVLLAHEEMEKQIKNARKY